MEFVNIFFLFFVFIVLASHKIGLEIGKELINNTLENSILQNIVNETIIEFLQNELILYMKIMNTFKLFAFNSLLTSYLCVDNRNQLNVDT